MASLLAPGSERLRPGVARGVSPCPGLEAAPGGWRLSLPRVPSHWLAAAAGSLLWASELGRGLLEAPSGMNLAGHLLKSMLTSNIVTGHGQWQCVFSRTEHAYFGFVAAEHRNYNCFFFSKCISRRNRI